MMLPTKVVSCAGDPSQHALIQADASQGGGGADSSAIGDDDNAARDFRRRTLVLLALPCAASVLALAGCVGQHTVNAGGSDRFPSETLTDWVSYADQVSVITVTAEHVIPPPADVEERGEGYIGREVTARIETTIWRRPGAPEAPAEIRYYAAGWVLKEGQRRLLATVGGSREAVNQRYLMPLVQVEAGEWGPLSGGSKLRFETDRVASSIMRTNDDTPAGESLAGKTTQEVARLLAETKPDPIAVKYADLPPDERFKAVQNEKTSHDLGLATEVAAAGR